MAEVYTSIYFKSDSAKHQRKLVSFFKSAQAREDDFAEYLCESASKISGKEMRAVTIDYQQPEPLCLASEARCQCRQQSLLP